MRTIKVVLLGFAQILIFFSASTAQDAPKQNPVVAYSPDTLIGVINKCNDSVAIPLTIYNNGNGPLFYEISQIADFFDGFENGMGKWVKTGYWGISTTAYEGSGSLAESPSGNYGGYWNYTVTMKDSVVVENEDLVAADFYMKFFFDTWYDRMYLQISVNGGNWTNVWTYGGSNASWLNLHYPLSDYAQNQDYFRLRFLFQSYYYDYVYDGCYIDNFSVSGLTNIIPWLSFSHILGSIPPGQSAVITVFMHSDSMQTGVYSGSLPILTNDPAQSLLKIPVSLNFTGHPVISASEQNINFGGVMTYDTDVDTLMVSNSGCDTLLIDSLFLFSGYFTAAMEDTIIPPGGYALVKVSFAPDTLGPYLDTLKIFNNDTLFNILLSGTGTDIPHIDFSPDSIFGSIFECQDTLSVPIMVYNSGNVDLMFSSEPGILGDVLPTGCIPYASYQSSEFGIRHFQFSTIDKNTAAGSVTEGYIDYSSTDRTMVEPGKTYSWFIETGSFYNENVAGWLDWNNNGIFEADEKVISPSVYGFTHTGSFTIPTHDVELNKGLRFRVVSDYYYANPPTVCGPFMYGHAEDFAVWVVGGNGWLKGIDTIAPGDSLAANVFFSSTGLSSGHYNSIMLLHSNDPLNHYLPVYCHLLIDGAPFLEISDSNLVYNDVLQYTSGVDTLRLFNSGCDTLKITSVNSDLDEFSAFFPVTENDSVNIPPYDYRALLVVFTPLDTGIFEGTLHILTNILDTVILLYGTVAGAPRLTAIPDSLHAVLSHCGDTAQYSVMIHNPGLDTLFWNVTFNESGSSLKSSNYYHYADMGNLGALPDQGCIEFWTWLNGYSQIYPNCISTGGLGNAHRNSGFRFELGTTGALLLLVGNDNNSYMTFTVLQTMPIQSWHHVALLWDKPANKLKVYFDGNLTFSNSSNTFWPSGLVRVMINVGWNSSRYWQGKMDEVRVWEIDRSQENIREYMIRELTGREPGLRAYWNLNEGHGSTVHDLTGHHYDGTVDSTLWDNPGVSLPDFVDVNPKSGSLGLNDTAYLTASYTTEKMFSGPALTRFHIHSNDPLQSSISIPCSLDLEGEPAVVIENSHFAFGPVMKGDHKTLYLSLNNGGCDTLKAYSVTNNLPIFEMSGEFSVLPFSSANIPLIFSPADTGYFTDTMIISTNQQMFSIYVTGQGIFAPQATTAPDSLSFLFQNCGDSLQSLFMLGNTGQAPLTYNIVRLGEFFEDFENGMLRWVKNDGWGIENTGYNSDHSLAESPSSSYPSNANYRVSLKDSLICAWSDSTSISFYMKKNIECDWDFLYLQISVNGGNWQTLATYSCGTSYYALFSESLAAYLNTGDYFKISFLFRSDPNGSQTGANIDNISIFGIPGSLSWLSFNPSYGTLLPDSSVQILVNINATALWAGQYKPQIYLQTNDPLAKLQYYPLNLTIEGNPFLLPESYNMIFPGVMEFTSKTDTLVLSNTGCDTLFISSISNGLPEFEVAPGLDTIFPYSTEPLVVSFHPLSTGLFTDALYLENNSNDTVLMLQGTGFGSPELNLQSDTITAVVGCHDSLVVNLGINNTGDGEMFYQFTGLSDLKNGLVAYYPFEGDHTDRSGNGHDLTSTGAVPDTGVGGYPNTAYFIDQDQAFYYANYNAISEHFFNPRTSIAFWAYLPGDYDYNSFWPYLFHLSYTWDGIEIYVYDTVVELEFGTTYSIYDISIPVGLNNYFHYAFTYDGSNARVYINGVLMQETPAQGDITYDDPYMGLGCVSWNDELDDFLRGKLDEVRIYDRGLTAEEVRLLYEIGHPADFLKFLPQGGTVNAGDSYEHQIQFTPDDFPAGIHYGAFLMETNDPFHPQKILHSEMSVFGQPIAEMINTDLEFDTLMQFAVEHDSAEVYNSGCDTLWIWDQFTSGGSFLTSEDTIFVLPLSSAWIPVDFSPVSQGWIEDTLVIVTSDTTLRVALSGYCIGMPVSIPTPSSFNMVLACTYVANDTLNLQNGGLVPLYYHLFKPANVTWLSIAQVQDTLLPGETSSFPITVNATGLAAGLYICNIQIISNDPANPTLSVPAYLYIANPFEPVNLGNDTAYCTGNSYMLPAGDFAKYLWNTGDTTSILTVNQPGIYSVTATDPYGCPSTDTIEISQLEYPVANAGPDTIICSGMDLHLSAQSAGTQPPESFDIYLGSGTSYFSGTGPNPFGTLYKDHRVQMLYRKMELNNLGFLSGYITSMGFHVSFPGSPAMQEFSIKMGHTTLNNLQSYTPGLQLVYYNPSYSSMAGWNMFDLIQDFFWNGQDNIIVEVCFDNNSYSSNSTYQYSEVAGSVIGTYCDNCMPGCNLTNGVEYSQRANIRFKGDNDITSYLWSGPDGFTSCYRDPIIHNIGLGASGIYTVSINNGYNCIDEDQKTITVIESPSVYAGQDTSVFQTDTIQLNAQLSGGYPPYSIHWYPTIGISSDTLTNPMAFPSITTIYHLTVNGTNSCAGRDSITIEVIPRYPVSGNIRYNNSLNTPMQNAKVYLLSAEEIKLDSALTDASGYFIFPLLTSGQYHLQVQTNAAPGGINATDALGIALHAVDLLPLSGLRKAAGDVNSSQTLSGADALLVLHRTVGNLLSFPAGDWVFEKKTFQLGPPGYDVSLFGLSMGDVNGSFVPGMKVMPTLNHLNKGVIMASQNEVVDIPVKFDQDIECGAFTLFFTYDERYLTLIEVNSEPENIIANTTNEQIRLAWQDAKGVKFKREVNAFILRFLCKEIIGDPEELSFVLENESEIAGRDGVPMNTANLLIPKLIIGKQGDNQCWLGQNKPNPFSDLTSIPYFINENGRVRLELYSIMGEKVLTLTNESQEKGYHEIGLDKGNLPPGIFTYRFSFSGKSSFYQASKCLVINH